MKHIIFTVSKPNWIESITVGDKANEIIVNDSWPKFMEFIESEVQNYFADEGYSVELQEDLDQNSWSVHFSVRNDEMNESEENQETARITEVYSTGYVVNDNFWAWFS